MNIVGGTVRLVVRAADATTAAAGAVGGAAVNGIIGGIQGTASGVRKGLGSGSHSTPAAVLALGAIGVAGLVEWPVLLAVGGGALVLHQLGRSGDGQQSTATPIPLKSANGGGPRSSTPSKSSSSPRRSRSGKASKAAGRSSA
jgi:hypothetical protein